ncbi:unnamed protein product, partial [Mesorhabditis belari]|uniref:Uncharacterized protein n=1 Tax=Mesorhabditis belari TaxID=2138241 RepID=A0AAF3FHG0_9BILA
MHLMMPRRTPMPTTIERTIWAGSHVFGANTIACRPLMRLFESPNLATRQISQRMAARRHPTRSHNSLFYLLATTRRAIKYSKETNLAVIRCCRNDGLVLVDDFSLCRLLGDRVDRRFLCDFADICVASSSHHMFVDVGPLSSLVNDRLSFCLSSSRFSSWIRLVGHSGISTHTTANALHDPEKNTAHND